MEKRIAYPMPHSGGYVVDPPIEAHGGKYVHVTVVRVDGPNGAETIAYPATGRDPLCWVEGWVSDEAFLDTFGYRVKRKPTTASGMVREFHETFGHPVADTPGLIDRERALLRYRLIAEELEELHSAILDNNLVEIADALTDLRYVTEGAALEWGIPADDCFAEVHDSNMSKLGEDGKPIHRADGKVLKGPNFWEPDLESILKQAGWGGPDD